MLSPTTAHGVPSRIAGKESGDMPEIWPLPSTEHIEITQFGYAVGQELMDALCQAFLCVLKRLYRRVHATGCQVSLQGVRLSGGIQFPDPGMHAIVGHLVGRGICHGL